MTAFPGYEPHRARKSYDVFFKCTNDAKDPTFDHIIGGPGAYIDLVKMVIVQPDKNAETDITQYTTISAYSVEREKFVFGATEL